MGNSLDIGKPNQPVSDISFSHFFISSVVGIPVNAYQRLVSLLEDPNLVTNHHVFKRSVSSRSLAEICESLTLFFLLLIITYFKMAVF